MFFPKKKTRKAQIVPDWRKVIPQAVRYGDTDGSRKKRLKNYLNTVFAVGTLLVVLMILAVVADRVVNGEPAEETRFAMTKLTVETDGALTEKWVRDFANIRERGADISLTALQRKLERYPQILKARVYRGNGNALRIVLKERTAVARFRQPDGKTVLLGSDGVLFPAETYFKNVQEDFPFVTDILLPGRGELKTIDNAPLLDFLNFTLQNYPHMLRGWESISGKDVQQSMLPAKFFQPWAVLRIKPYFNPDSELPNINEIVFSAQNFREELKLLGSADTAKKVRDFLSEHPNSREKKYRITFIINRKNERQPHLEMRIIPVRGGRLHNW